MIAALVFFALFTTPNGSWVWVARDQVVAVRAAVQEECYRPSTGTDANTVIITPYGSYCVTDPPLTVVNKLENSK